MSCNKYLSQAKTLCTRHGSIQHEHSLDKNNNKYLRQVWNLIGDTGVK